MNGFGEPLGSNLVFALGCAMAALLAGLWRERRAGETACLRDAGEVGQLIMRAASEESSNVLQVTKQEFVAAP